MSETAGERLRIAIFGESYLPYLSGVTVATEALARGLTKAGHDVLLVMPRPAVQSPSPPPSASGGEPAIAWLPSYQGPPAPTNYRMPLPVPSAALRAARAFRPNVVHAQSPFVSGLMARSVARAVRAPLIFTHHTRFGDYRHYLGPLAGPAAALVAAYLLRYWLGSAAIVAPGSELAADIEASLAAARRTRPMRLPLVRVIPTGIDVATLAALPEGHPRREAGWVGGVDFVVASLGRLAPEKSVDVLADSFSTVARARPDLRFLLIGGGPSEGEMRGRAQGALAGRLYVTGQRPRLEALALLKACELFAFASRTETQGLVLAEALACGVPVVALEGPGVRDSVRDGIDGVVVPRDGREPPAAALAAAIMRLADDHEGRISMAAAAFEGAPRFDLQRWIGEIVELYREAIARG